MRSRILIVLTLLLTTSAVFGQFSQKQHVNLDSLRNSLTLEQKVGQLFMVAAYSNKSVEHQRYLQMLVRNYHIGGVIAMQGGPARQRRMLESLQQIASVPLLVGQDAEWGQAMRLDSTYKFPTSLTVGAGSYGPLAKELGTALAKECQKVGVHMSFSPVLDVNTNPSNPIIGARSFGSDPANVSLQGTAVIEGLQEQGVLACGKHFPGHGDTQSDSHKTLPKVDRTLEQLKAVEWVPFKAAVDAGVASFMIAHLNIPSLEPSGKPTSLSPTVIDGVLRKEWGYDGLVITDALNMKGVSEFAPIGALEIEAFKAGNDILLFPMDVPKAAAQLVQAFKDGRLDEAELDRRVDRILRAKWQTRAVLDWELAQEGEMTTTLAALHPAQEPVNTTLTFKFALQAPTLLPAGTAEFPIKNLTQDFTHVTFGDGASASVVKEYLDRYVEMDHVTITSSFSLPDVLPDAWIVSFHQNVKNPWKRYKLTASDRATIAALVATGKPLYVLHFANPYGLLTYPDLGDKSRVLVLYENDATTQMIAPQMLFGARGVHGTLPVDLGADLPAGSGVHTAPIERLSYGLPFEVGLSEGPFQSIDSTMLYAIAQGATPGGQILVARKGTVVYQKSFGAHTYGGRAVDWKDLYDIASVTKITATLPGMMQWYEKQPLLLGTTLGNHTDRLAGSNKEHLVIEDVLAHQSGLAAWIPYYLKTIKNDSVKAYWYSSHPQPGYSDVGGGLWIRETVRDTMFSMLAESDLKSKEYRYSDLGYYLFQEMLEERFNEPLDQWARNTFYGPLGAKRLTYTPLEHGFSLDEIVPTEEDGYWRNTTVHGTVHDMGAAMIGGVAGHAGLFANANDLAKMMQLYLNGGSYGGVRYLQESTLEKFTSCAFCELQNRRGLGFDRPQLEDRPGPSCTCASARSFGHTGFTGTMVWMDPKEELLYIFLSNRTFPDMENWKLSRMDVRTNIQEFIYEALR